MFIKASDVKREVRKHERKEPEMLKLPRKRITIKKLEQTQNSDP